MSALQFAPDTYWPPVDDSDDAIKVAQMRYMRSMGIQWDPADCADQKVARIDDHRVLIDCSCGSGATVSRRRTAHCFNCGRIYRGVTLPEGML